MPFASIFLLFQASKHYNSCEWVNMDRLKQGKGLHYQSKVWNKYDFEMFLKCILCSTKVASTLLFYQKYNKTLLFWKNYNLKYCFVFKYILKCCLMHWALPVSTDIWTLSPLWGEVCNNVCFQTGFPPNWQSRLKLAPLPESYRYI